MGLVVLRGFGWLAKQLRTQGSGNDASVKENRIEKAICVPAEENMMVPDNTCGGKFR